MPRIERIGSTELRRLRVAAQLLHRPRRREPDAIVRHLVGVQAQVPVAAALALRARSPGVTELAVRRARLEDRTIVVGWAMRGTLHLLTADDVRSLVPLLAEPHVARSRRRLREEGMTGDDPERAVRLIERMLGRDGPMTRGEIAERLARRGIRTGGQAIAHLVWLAASGGAICFGPERDGAQTFVLVRDWLGERPVADRERVLADLALRYVRAHGPARPEDLAAWSGLRARDARRAWGSIGGRLTEIRTAAGAMWLHPKGPRPVADVVRLLPAFDEYLLGWKDRSFAVGTRDRARINAGGGWVHPAVIEDGRVVATWKAVRGRGTIEIGIEPFRSLSTTVDRRVRAEVHDIARFVGERAELGFRA